MPPPGTIKKVLDNGSFAQKNDSQAQTNLKYNLLGAELMLRMWMPFANVGDFAIWVTFAMRVTLNGGRCLQLGAIFGLDQHADSLDAPPGLATPPGTPVGP